MGLRHKQIVDDSIVDRWVQYLSSHKDDYTLAPIVAVVDERVVFDVILPEMLDIGSVKIPMSARLIIVDGQHRRDAIKLMLGWKDNLGEDTIPVMLIPDQHFDRVADIYVDLHPDQMRITRSKRVLSDHSDLAALVRQLVGKLPLFQGLTELEKTTISNRSTALFTLSAVYQATQALLGVGAKEPIRFEQADIVRQFWMILGDTIPEWRQVISGEMTAAMARRNYIHSHTVTLLAIGMAGHQLITDHPREWTERMKLLGAVDWSRNNKTLWEGRAMVRGKMNKSRDSISLTASALKRALGLELNERELALEHRLSAS